ncbi:GNAT family N-acetyltransferase [Chondromyces crocatus]|uniref:Amino-acid acetyltransferase n=1 Tax=Chondromyces crocatus TaxID=52 RepID=A0A0K1EHT9_CHOCO|nr:GNAT family N-acetyltransferase [Chondromyces crocatus]AKT40441.1 amino-acid acetyltransferase [Chondromyces crocatus]
MEAERTPPDRIRVTKLQEAQLPALIEIEQACAAMYRDIGLDDTSWPPRTLPELVASTRDHDLLVAEADHQVVGFLIWRDEAPGVARLIHLVVHPDYQRFGIARRLLETLQDSARAHDLSHIVSSVWDRAPWALAFCREVGLQTERAGEGAPEAIQRWSEQRKTAGEELLRPGERLVWRPIPPAVEPEEEDDETPPPIDDAET